jgi:hypothetical protein
MGKWRTRLLFNLILYSAGFATAVYVLAPSPAAASDGSRTCERSMGLHSGTAEAGFGSQDWAIQMRAGMDKVKSFAEENAIKGIQAVKVWVDQRRQDSGQ